MPCKLLITKTNTRTLAVSISPSCSYMGVCVCVCVCVRDQLSREHLNTTLDHIHCIHVNLYNLNASQDTELVLNTDWQLTGSQPLCSRPPSSLLISPQTLSFPRSTFVFCLLVFQSSCYPLSASPVTHACSRWRESSKLCSGHVSLECQLHVPFTTKLFVSNGNTHRT